MDVHHNLPKKPTSFSSDFFALALRICLRFYFFCNICIHVGIYCLLMTHTSMITSEISHRFWESPANEVIHSCLFFMYSFFLFSSTSSQTKRCLFYAQTTGSVLKQCLHSDKQCSDWPRVRMHLLQNKKKLLSSATVFLLALSFGEILVIFFSDATY